MGDLTDRIPEDLDLVPIWIPEIEGAASVPVVSRTIVDDDPAVPQLPGDQIDFHFRLDPKAEMVEGLRL